MLCAACRLQKCPQAINCGHHTHQGGTVNHRQAANAPLHEQACGLHHLCLEAYSRSVVDERAEWARSVGAEIESEPQEYGYIPGYYAVFFYDPDGIKLEIVHIPGQAA